MDFELLLRRTANAFGIDITRYRPERTEAGRLASMLRHHRIDQVIDVGANIGQFAMGLRRSGYRGEMVSFEPLSEAHCILTRNSSGDDQWVVPPPVAVGDAEGGIDIHIAGNLVSSSALGMLDAHRESAPESAFIGTERVRMATLDSLMADQTDPTRRTFLKIDTQGYEDKVLDGARETLAQARGLQIELSLVPLYEGQALFDTLLERLRAAGFAPWGIQPGFYSDATGRMLQVDVVMFRDDASTDNR